MRLRKAPRGLACDTITPINAEMAAALVKRDVRTIFRYLDRVEDISRGQMGTNLTRTELGILLDAGLCVSPVQYYSTGYASQCRGSALCTAYGIRLGRIAAANACALGIPEGCLIWRDLEAVPRATPRGVTADLIGWARGAASGGYDSGLYYGSGLGSAATDYVTGEDLWALPYYRSYWRAASVVPQVPNRGPCVTQGLEQTIRLGSELVTVDYDLIALDCRYQQDRQAGDRSPGRFMVVSA